MPDTSASAPRRRWTKWLAFAALAFGAFIAAANLYVVRRARATTVTEVELAPVRPYAIVLGNQVNPDGSPCPDLEMRLQTGLALYKAGRAGKIIVSGGVRGNYYDEPRAMVAWLEARDVPRADIIADPGGHRTAATMADSAALGVRSAHVVSQGYHLPRALYLAGKAGIDASGVPAPKVDGGPLEAARIFCRETLARAETLVEVALRGVR
jgi:SanA protein